jgi:predicted ATPase
MLVVLDNCEHLLDGSARVAEALVPGGGLHVLATSREPLGAAGETVWRIPPLALPPASEADPERLRTFDAVRLFVERAASAVPAFRLDAETAPAVAHICQRLDGLPLALELAAARVRTLSVGRLADGLDDRFRLLTGGPRTAPRDSERCRVGRWSHGLLDESGASSSVASAFRGAVQRRAAEAVAADDDIDRFEVADVLARLVDKEPVQLDGDRHRLPETLRHYASERERGGTSWPVRARHLAWFGVARRGVSRRLARFPVLDEVAAEAPDLLAALEWSLETDADAVVDLSWPLASWLGRRGASEELRALARQVLGPVAEGSPAWMERLAPFASDLFFAGDIAWMPAAMQALETEPPVGSPAACGNVRLGVILGASFVGRHEALAALEQTGELGRSLGNENLEGTSLLALASTVAYLGDAARVASLLPWLERNVPADACMRFLLDNAHAWTAAFEGRLDVARARVLPYLDTACPFAIATQIGVIGLFTEDADLVDGAIRAAERNFSTGAFVTSMRWLRAIRPLLAGDLDEAGRLLADDPAPWLMLSASANLRIMAAELAQRGPTGPRLALLDEVMRIADAAAPSLRGGRAATASPRVVAPDGRDASARPRGARVGAERGLHVVTVEAPKLALSPTGCTVAHAAGLLGAAVAFRERTGFRWRHPAIATPRRVAVAARRRRAPGRSRPRARRRGGAGPARPRGHRRPDTGWDSLTPTEVKVWAGRDRPSNRRSPRSSP